MSIYSQDNNLTMAAPAAPAGGPPTGADGKAAIPSKDDIMKIKAQKKMQQQQAEVDEVIGIMHKNVENV